MDTAETVSMTDPAKASEKPSTPGLIERVLESSSTGNMNTIAAPMQVDAPAIEERYSGARSISWSVERRNNGSGEDLCLH